MVSHINVKRLAAMCAAAAIHLSDASSILFTVNDFTSVPVVPAVMSPYEPSR